MSKSTNGDLLECVLEPICAALNKEAARKLVGIKADRKLQARIAKLARKCNEGELTDDERAEYEMYILVGDLIAILQARARMLLAKRRQPA